MLSVGGGSGKAPLVWFAGGVTKRVELVGDIQTLVILRSLYHCCGFGVKRGVGLTDGNRTKELASNHSDDDNNMVYRIHVG